MIKARSAAAVCHRRRGSVLVLVMTLLGILFVTGVAFLASMNFEAQVVSIERGRDRRAVGIEAALDETVSALREGMVGDGGAPFGGSLDEPLASAEFGVAPIMLGELPGVHNLFAPIEPYQDASGNFRYRWYTDLLSLTGRDTGSFENTLNRRVEVPVSATSGVADPNLEFVPVDSDGDGVTDTFQFPMGGVSGLRFSKAQVAELSRTLNPSSNPGGDVFLGMRVIAHGAMVNLNESHPTLIINVLGLDQHVLNYELTSGPMLPDLDFNHSPSTLGVKYSPQLEEPVLRRRVLLPPRIIAPSLLHGNALLDPQAADQKFGFADMPNKLFPADPDGVPLDTVFEGAHRYVPFDGLSEEYDPNTPLWLARMEPFASFNADNTGNTYDRRHLVTTVSHDDLLSRGGRVVSELDAAGVPTADIELREAMIRVNRSACQAGNGFPFVYADYPQNMEPGVYTKYPDEAEPGGCACLEDPDCKLNARKGRLTLSLAWLDDKFPCEVDPGDDRTLCMLIRSRLIHDVFMMLLRNARGEYWKDVPCPNGPIACDVVGGFCDMGDPDPATWQCYDPVTGLSPRESLISRTAASLTANLIDYMDFDDTDGDGWDDGIPTRVALRSFDFSDPTTVGRELGPATNPSMPQQYVFGLERQPYITEVTTAGVGTRNNVTVGAWAVELYNPYPDDLIYSLGVDEYVLMQVDLDGDVFEVPLQRDILGGPNGMFTVFSTDFAGVRNVVGKSRVYDTTTTGMQFENGWTIYLVRRVRLVGETDRTDIVVDQFALDGAGTNVGRTGDLSGVIPPGNTPPFVFSQERFIPDPTPPPPPAEPQSRWTATVPVTVELPLGVHTLGDWSAPSGAKPMPVEVNFANTGSFTQLDPADDPFDPVRGVAFPTTGSMLMLMRHANREFSDRSIATMKRGSGGLPDDPILHDTADLAFTTWLDQVSNVGPSPGIDVLEREQIDNGRMPVFDLPVQECTVSRVRCRSKADCTGASETCDQIAPAVHHADPGAAVRNVPGGTEHLPWGQLLWDYFTVLPLSSQGPYPAWEGPDPPYTPAAADSIPRVDLDGLRVHGRININAAPWMVMGGLPLTPMWRIPESFRDKTRDSLGLVPAEDVTAKPIPDVLAMAIVAYRDAREITLPGGTDTTGDFGGIWRGWNEPSPLSRRGTGFLTIGELANVRHTSASDPFFRVDSGELDARELYKREPDYVKAVALLVSLGDWVTVRSHVFTTYGTLRGEGDVDRFPDDEDERADDVDKRAVRFQETVDRLPTLLGASKPTRIGQRYVGPYIDVRND